MTIQIQNERIFLLPQKAIFWERKKILAFSDVHFGKAESLQKAGLPLPSESHADDFRQMERLIEEWRPERILILGDLIHDRDSWAGSLQEDLIDFFQRHSQVQWHLILGNHDKGSLPHLGQLPLQLITDTFLEPPFCFAHGHNAKSEAGFRIEGHIHPVLTLTEGPLRLRFPCFVLEKEKLLLPSFGILTGGSEIGPSPQTRRFAVTPREVFEVANRPQRSAPRMPVAKENSP